MQNEQLIRLKGIVLTQENICDLIGKLEQYYDKCKIDVSFENGISKTELTRDEFKKENFKNIRIEKIRFHLKSTEDSNNSFTLDKVFLEDIYYINYAFNHYEKFSAIKYIVEEWLKNNSTKKGLVKFANSSWPLILFSLVILIPNIFILTVFFINIALFLWSVAATVISIGIAYLLWTFLKFMYPYTVVDIGYNHIIRMRKWFGWVFSSILLPLISSVIVAVIFN